MKDQLSKMVEIATAIRDRDLAELAKKQAHRRGAELARMDLLEQASVEAQTALDEPSYRREFEAPRKVWHAARIRVLSFEEARSATLVEMQKKITAKSLGRAAVLEKLAEQQAMQRKRSKNN